VARCISRFQSDVNGRRGGEGATARRA